MIKQTVLIACLVLLIPSHGLAAPFSYNLED